MAAMTTFPLEAAVAAVRLMMETEDRFRPAPGYADRLLSGATPITTWMRRDLIDWLVEVRVPPAPRPRPSDRLFSRMRFACALMCARSLCTFGCTPRRSGWRSTTSTATAP